MNKFSKLWIVLALLWCSGGGFLLRTAAQNTPNRWRQLTQLRSDFGLLRTVKHGAANYGWADGPNLYRSEDGGQTWTPTNSPGGQPLMGFSYGGKLYLGIDSTGLFVSADDGQTWSRVEGFVSRFPSCFLARGTTLWVGTHDVGLQRSLDGGATWRRFGSGLPDGGAFVFFQSLALSGPNLVAATNQGIFLSSDDGQSWRAPQQQINYAWNRMDENGQPQVVDGQSGTEVLLPDGAALLVATGGGLLRSEDNGETWQASDTGLTSLNPARLSVNSLTRQGARLVATTFYGGVFCSDDGGRTWRRCQQGLDTRFPFSVFTLGDRLYVGTSDRGFFVSTNRGETWQPQAWPQFLRSARGPVRALAQTGNSLFALTQGAGLHVSTSGGASWSVAEPGNSGIYYHALVAGNAELLRLTKAGPSSVSGLTRSTDDGVYWWPYLNDGLIHWNGRLNPDFKAPGNLNAIARIGAHLYVGTEQAGLKIAYNVDAKAWVGQRLSDGFTPAKAWTVANTGLTNLNVQVLLGFDNRVFAGTKGGVFVSSDEGRNWTAVNAGLSNLDIVTLTANATHLFAATTGGVFVSANRGQSWMAANAGLTDLKIQAFAANGTNLFAGTASGVFYSTDNGQSWRALTDGLSDRNVTALLATNATVYAGMTEGSVFALDAPSAPARAATNVSAASYDGAALAPASIVSVFGIELATATRVAAVTPLPTTLGGTTVKIKDSLNVERPAQLFFVSPSQINYLLPAECAVGSATVTITSGDGKLSAQQISIAAVAPGVFTADASGRGMAAATVLRVKADGTQSYEPVAQFDPAQNRFTMLPIDLGAETDQVFLLLFGTGLRYRSSLAGVTAKLGGTDAQVLYAGAQTDFTGLDQVNVRLPRSLAGRGEIDVTLTADGKAANVVRVRIK